MWPRILRAAAGSRYSSTNFTASPSLERGLGRELADLVVVDAAQLLDEVQRAGRLLLVDLGHGEPDVDEHPVADLDAAGVAHDQADVDLTADTVDIDGGPVIGRVDDLDHLAGNPETHL